MFLHTNGLNSSLAEYIFVFGKHFGRVQTAGEGYYFSIYMKMFIFNQAGNNFLTNFEKY